MHECGTYWEKVEKNKPLPESDAYAADFKKRPVVSYHTHTEVP